ncbi:MAG: ADP-forming succinate--CoA ligase subunit beta [Candidatus Latescibacteria bacterium]|nr:ADP-forming succinate--CoA ligase subunit beta [bacterium]MBD3424082.1 ADP-forming succinate--CoA ligase subunit beta [Candidatus Latescibacterota bacterium]
MKLQEVDSRGIFSGYGLPVPESILITDPAEAGAAAKKLGCPVVVKAQVLVGGRGKAGGVKLANTPEEAAEKAEKIYGMDIKGLKVQKVLIAKAVDIEREFYVGVVIDRSSRMPLIMVSPAGGVDIETVASENPEKILKTVIDPAVGILPFQLRGMAGFLSDDKEVKKQIAKAISALYQAFMGVDASLAEINPLVESPDGKVWAIDAKINIDDSGLYRQKKIAAMRDTSAEAEAETQAREESLSFVKLDGNVGCIVNGAGLAMATMDMIKHYGAEPANFLDIGGSSSPEKVLAALNIILRDENVKSILINIFGGITRCDDVANGIIEARKKMDMDLPMVVRLTGTNSEKAMEILADTDLIAASSMEEGVKKAIEAAK